MQYGLTTKQLESINAVFQQFPEIESAVIYGSRAKGNFKIASDIDITLKGNKLDLGILSRVDMALDDLLFPYKFDVSIHHQIDNPGLLDHIEKVGKICYKSNTLLIRQ